METISSHYNCLWVGDQALDLDKIFELSIPSSFSLIIYNI